MVHNLEELNAFVKRNDLRKKFWSSTKISYECSKCKKVSEISILQFKRKFTSSAVLCNDCRKATFDRSKHGHHWTEEEKRRANETRKKTCLKKYGVEYITQTPEVIQSIHNAAKNRTDEERSISSQKRRETNLKKYGCESPIGNSEIRKRIEDTCLEKYGTKNPAASEEIKDKIRNTFNSKYGMNPLSTVKVREKIQATMKERYGVQFISQNPSFAKNISESLMKYGEAAFLERCKENNVKPIDFHYRGYYDGKPIYYKCRCLKCGNEIEIAPHNNNFKCYICYGKNSISSYEEKEIVKFIESVYDGRIEKNYRRLISPLEVDIYAPEKKLAIEFDGNFWHNESSKDKNYHKMKTQLCENRGVHLIHVFEYEWINNEDKIKSILKSFFATDSQKVFARNCSVKEISSDEAKAFSSSNHLQGHANASVYLGLFHNDELVEIETFGHPRFCRKYEWELVRECSKKDMSVVGGKSKLFSYFVKHYDPESVVSYCDASKFTGDSYLKCGMKLTGWNSPGYVWSYGNKILSRYQCQKHKLVKEHPGLKESTETEIMHALGYAKIYDSGQKVFSWSKAQLI